METLYDKSSLILNPGVYDTGKVYATKPFDGSGDLTFTRTGDTATRVNADGLVEKVRTSLFTYNTDFTNAAWTKQGTTAVANQIANPVNGALDADLFYPNSSGTYRAIRRTIGASLVEVGISIYAKAGGKNILFFNDSAGTRQVAFNLSDGTYVNTSATAISMDSLGGGWYRCAFSVITEVFYMCVSDSTGNSSVTANGTDGIYIWGQQTEYGVPTEFIGVTTTAAVSVGPVANVPRLDYLGSSCPRLLLEPQRTNVYLNSENFATSDSISGGAITSNVETSPDGYLNADKIQGDGSSSTFQVFNNITVAASTIYTFSVFAKAGNTNFVELACTNMDTDTEAVFDLSLGTITLTGASSNPTITNYGNGWYRCSIQMVAQTTDLSGRFRIYVPADGSGGAWVGTAANGKNIFLYGRQLEVGAYATSYIPTLGAAVTRGADGASKTGISSLIGQTEGTIVLDVENNESEVSSFITLSPSAATLNNHIYLGQSAAGNLTLYVRNGGTYSIIAGSITSITGIKKIALAYGPSFARIYVNGTQVYNSTSAVIPSGMDKIEINSFNTSGDIGRVSIGEALIFKTILPNSDLAALTA